MAAAAAALARGIPRTRSSTRCGVRGRRAPPRAGRADRRRALGQRLQGDERRLHARRRCASFDGRRPPDPRRAAKGQGFAALRDAGRRRVRAPSYLIGEAAPSSRAELQGGRAAARAAATSSARSRAARGRGAAGRGRAAVAGVHELRPVRATSRTAAHVQGPGRRGSERPRQLDEVLRVRGGTGREKERRRVEAPRAPAPACPYPRARPRQAPQDRVPHPAHRHALPAGLRRGDGLQRLLGPHAPPGRRRRHGFLIRYVPYGALGLVRDAVRRAPPPGRGPRAHAAAAARVLRAACVARPRCPASAWRSTARAAGSAPARCVFQPSELAEARARPLRGALLAERPGRIRPLGDADAARARGRRRVAACRHPSPTSAPRS